MPTSGHEVINKLRRVALPAAALGATAALAIGLGSQSSGPSHRTSNTIEAISITPHHVYESYKGCAPIGNLAITGVVVHEGGSLTFYGDDSQNAASKGEYSSILQTDYDNMCHTETANRQSFIQSTEPAEQFITVVKY